MKKSLTVIIVIAFVGISSIVLAGCANGQQEMETRVTPTIPITITKPVTQLTSVPALSDLRSIFPLQLGNTWVYSSTHYQDYGSLETRGPGGKVVMKCCKTITATYIITETVVDLQTSPPYFVAQLYREESLVSASDEWSQEQSGWLGTYWYIIRGAHVYQQRTELDLSAVDENSNLEYIFPLELNQRWYPNPGQRKQFPDYEVVSGLRKVSKVGKVKVPAGGFEQCFQLKEIIGGSTFETWFCPGVGIVDTRSDHSGTPFGFRSVLINYTLHPPLDPNQELRMLATPSPIGDSPPSPPPTFPTAQSARDRVKASAVVLYTTRAGAAPFPLLAWPELPVLNRPEFRDIYGNQPGIGYHLDNFTPALNATGSHLLISGIGGTGPDGPREVGAGTWLANLHIDQVYKLWDRPVAATWSPDGEQLAYVENDTLYLRPRIEEAEARGIFTTTNLWPLFVSWSPNGDWIATATNIVGEAVAGRYPPITNTVWLVSPTDAQQRQLGAFPGYPVEHIRRELQWSPDGTALLVGMVSPNYIVHLEGQQYSLEEGSQGLAWVPHQSHLLVRKKQGLFLVDRRGQEISQVADHFVTAWAFSDDGRYLAYRSKPVADNPADIFVFDLMSGETRPLGSAPTQTISSLHWTPASDVLIADDGDYRTPIWAIAVEPGGKVEVLIEKGLLLTVIPVKH